jgi:hypothetical protein
MGCVQNSISGLYKTLWASSAENVNFPIHLDGSLQYKNARSTQQRMGYMENTICRLNVNQTSIWISISGNRDVLITFSEIIQYRISRKVRISVYGLYE